MRIPASVKVGAYSYKVERVVRPIAQDGTPLWGRHSTMEQLIVVDEGASEERASATFLHEALHALDDLVDLGLTEEQVTRLAPALLSFLRDNHLLREE